MDYIHLSPPFVLGCRPLAPSFMFSFQMCEILALWETLMVLIAWVWLFEASVSSHQMNIYHLHRADSLRCYLKKDTTLKLILTGCSYHSKSYLTLLIKQTWYPVAEQSTNTNLFFAPNSSELLKHSEGKIGGLIQIVRQHNILIR